MMSTQTWPISDCSRVSHPDFHSVYCGAHKHLEHHHCHSFTIFLAICPVSPITIFCQSPTTHSTPVTSHPNNEIAISGRKSPRAPVTQPLHNPPSVHHSIVSPPQRRRHSARDSPTGVFDLTTIPTSHWVSRSGSCSRNEDSAFPSSDPR